ncbi:hypothetical protein IWW36_001700 [Coemansia brasiliensis]|uniref:DUF8032 domain-containing protein n=1 Tax=Coemansia brasiliensis TaxID=2650707 RepID=A0A9W8M039_9FUNG|nr:hypothetical protein IWW36_001700 [Coemansia brasiliensis]
MWPASTSQATQTTQAKAAESKADSMDLWSRGNEMNLLSELLETIDSNNTLDTEEGTITTEAVLQGLKSLDEFEQQAAMQPDSAGANDKHDFGSFNQEELSAALEQIYWGSLKVAPHVDPADISVPPTQFHSPDNSCSHTQSSTPHVAVGYADDMDNARDGDSDEDNMDGNPMELEELSLFSLFLSDMKAFEAFLSNLSLNQLRQCAATVNSVLVQRESSMANNGEQMVVSASLPQPTTSASDSKESECGSAGLAKTAESEMLPNTTLSLLREWLPPSTADCVITALQAANLPIPSSSAETSSSTAASTSKAAKESVGSHSTDASSPNDPQVETKEGIPWLSFVYAQKGKPKRHRIRIDIDRAPQSAIPASFQQNNCVYPRANCTRQAYAGNRWNYETECNKLGWKLAFLNQELLTGRRGLLQTAVNNYRSAVAGRKSRRVTRMEKAERSAGSKSISQKRTYPAADTNEQTAVAEKRPKCMEDAMQLVTPPPTATSAAIEAQSGDYALSSPLPMPRTASAPLISSNTQSPQTAKCLLISAYVSNRFTRIRIAIDLGTIPAASVDQRFRRDHAVFPRALNTPRSRYHGLRGRWEFELTCNELAWRLAWLNKSRLKGRKPLIQKCLDAYRERFRTPPWELLECFSEMMDKSVDPGFFDYWSPRPGKLKRMEIGQNRGNTLLKKEGDGLPASGQQQRMVHQSVDSSSESSVESSAARARPVRPRTAPATSSSSKPVARPPSFVTPKPPANSSNSSSSGVPTNRPRPPPAAAASVGPRPAAARPQVNSQPCNPSTPRPPMNAAQPRPLRPPSVSKSTTPKPPRPNTPVRPAVSSKAPRPASAATTSASSAVRQRPAVSPRPMPVQNRQRPNTPTRVPNGAPAKPSSKHVQIPSPVSSKPNAAENSKKQQKAAEQPGKSAKAQVAADVLTDVLRRLAKNNPSLASIPGIFEPDACIESDDDSLPLDAKVAELERLITDLQRN